MIVFSVNPPRSSAAKQSSMLRRWPGDLTSGGDAIFTTAAS